MLPAFGQAVLRDGDPVYETIVSLQGECLRGLEGEQVLVELSLSLLLKSSG